MCLAGSRYATKITKLIHYVRGPRPLEAPWRVGSNSVAFTLLKRMLLRVKEKAKKGAKKRSFANCLFLCQCP